MKAFIFTSLVAVASASAYAFAQEPDVFLETGHRQCTSVCSETAMEAESDATELANKACKPLLAYQVSRWQVKIFGYGRLYATAAFTCIMDDEATAAN
jgi:hypothetical protein